MTRDGRHNDTMTDPDARGPPAFKYLLFISFVCSVLRAFIISIISISISISITYLLFTCSRFRISFRSFRNGNTITAVAPLLLLHAVVLLLRSFLEKELPTTFYFGSYGRGL